MQLRLLVASWNVGNAMPPKSREGVHDWVPAGGGGFDVIAVGLQESSYREKSASESEREGGRTMSRKSSRSVSAVMTECEGGEEAEAPQEEDYDVQDDEEDEEVEEDGGEEGEEVEEEEEEASTPPSNTHEVTSTAKKLGLAAGDVIIKKLNAKRSIRRVKRLVRQVSSNIRESVADALDYPFARQLTQHLGEQYVLVAKVELLEMRLLVFVHSKHRVSGIEKHSIATGLGSVIGNKGGLILKLVLHNTSLCFVSCHLAAHQDQKFLDKRNADCTSILHASLGLHKHLQMDHQFDHCFWFGDLNYRVDLNYTQPKNRTHDEHVHDVRALVRAKKWTVLNANDQLQHQIEQHKTLFGWELPPALFPPTFKRVRATTDQYNPQRVPSYCDRVLYKSLPGLRSSLKLLEFQSVDSISTSDHKPVRASFQLMTTPRITVTPMGALRDPTTVEFRDLQAKDLLGMDMTGLSDPYVKFYSLPECVLQRDSSGSHPTTATIMNTLAPRWTNEQIPVLSLRCETDVDVKRVHLVLLFMDYDATSMDDRLGVVTLSLDKYTLAKPRFVPFEAQIVRHGKPAGTVSAKIRVVLPHQKSALSQQEEDATARGDVAMRMAGCHCAIS
ncbi:hypothetical protein Poli38472_012886 [Pythium oligandrum]|uniref:C2 domain-containing protein n=1 Tax=Pythium oligandrum TaxID=41045 RepID=A0A8K1CJL7_PYTOL|nr:hypothetical protein Poli38472_012886 [Pythium oligandrum]|eukprot:TMW64264.1 hypothetical protein Poli38472_012886 [Pythium oligandrum]